jgi:Cytochrome c554 and c-prime
VALIVSGDTAGWIMPCGCTANQSGGLSRRGTLVAKARADRAVVVVDCGGAPGGTSLYERLKFEAILTGELAMGIAAHNLGAPEAALGAEYLRGVQQKLGIPFVSTNLRDASGAAVAPSSLELRAPGSDLRILLLGVVSPRLVKGGLKAGEPRDAILTAIKKAAAHDAVIVLAYVPEAELRQLASELPEVDAVLGGPTGQSIAPFRTGPTWVGSATNKGKFLIELETPAKAAPWSAKVIELGPSIADDDAQEQNLAAFRTELARLDFTAVQSGLAPPPPPNPGPGYRIAGTPSCTACHQDDSRVHEHSKHAIAWQTLEGRGLHIDPQCQTCHTTGYGLPGGFQSVSRSHERTSVGCESCHGPSQGHALEPRTRTPFAARDQCIVCHDSENSPQFSFDLFWKKIVHGKKSTAVLDEPRKEHP